MMAIKSDPLNLKAKSFAENPAQVTLCSFKHVELVAATNSGGFIKGGIYLRVASLPYYLFFLGGWSQNVSYIFWGALGGIKKVSYTPPRSQKLKIFGGEGGV